jgi:unspecific monooxygenase
MEFVQYFSELIAYRRDHLGDDLLSGLISANTEGSALSHGELISTCILLLVAGHETTVHLISGGALALIDNPDQLERFRNEPELTKSAVEEMLRYVSPVQLTGRNALADIEIGDVTIKEGDRCMLLLGSANRDPDVFENPGEFDISRTGSNHLGFGFGLHHCLGAPLARLESQVALTELFRRARTIESASNDRKYRDTIVLRGLSELPVTISA